MPERTFPDFRELQKRLAARAADMYATHGTDNPVAVAVDIVADEILQMLEDGPSPFVLSAIKVNGMEHLVGGAMISYEQVAELAGKPGATHLTMTYHRTGWASGSMIAGESIPLRAGTYFCAVNTSNA